MARPKREPRPERLNLNLTKAEKGDLDRARIKMGAASWTETIRRLVERYLGDNR